MREFFKARNELSRREIQRAIKTPVRRSLTDAIRDSGENERMHGHAYDAYTNLAYKAATIKHDIAPDMSEVPTVADYVVDGDTGEVIEVNVAEGGGPA